MRGERNRYSWPLFCLACRQPAAVLEFREAPLDEISERVDVAVDGRLDFPVPARWNDGLGAASREVFADRIAVVALVGDQDFGFGARLVHDGAVACEVGDFTARECDGDGQPDAVGSQMDLGRVAATRAAKILALSPPFAPAAC